MELMRSQPGLSEHVDPEAEANARPVDPILPEEVPEFVHQLPEHTAEPELIDEPRPDDPKTPTHETQEPATPVEPTPRAEPEPVEPVERVETPDKPIPQPEQAEEVAQDPPAPPTNRTAPSDPITDPQPPGGATQPTDRPEQPNPAEVGADPPDNPASPDDNELSPPPDPAAPSETQETPPTHEPPTTTDEPEATQDDTVFSEDEVDTPLRFDRQVAPTASARSRRQNETGTVEILVHVDAEGNLVDVRVLDNAGYPRLADAALRALSASTFHPATRDGQPVASTRRIEYQF